jgi:high affinity Mn2+ porin
MRLRRCGMDMKFVHLFGISTFCALAMHQPAASADLPVKAPTKPSPFDWTGFYFGGHVGYATGRSNWSATQVGARAPILTGSLDLFNLYDAFKGTGSFFNGLQAGYNYMLPSRVVLGTEIDMSPPNTCSDSRVVLDDAGERASAGVVLTRTYPLCLVSLMKARTLVTHSSALAA